MKSKFPSRKMVIPSPTEAQWNEERASIDRESNSEDNNNATQESGITGFPGLSL